MNYKLCLVKAINRQQKLSPHHPPQDPVLDHIAQTIILMHIKENFRTIRGGIIIHQMMKTTLHTLVIISIGRDPKDKAINGYP